MGRHKGREQLAVTDGGEPDVGWEERRKKEPTQGRRRAGRAMDGGQGRTVLKTGQTTKQTRCGRVQGCKGFN